MKKIIFLIALIMLSVLCYGQEDIYSLNGKLGIGIVYPTEKLEISGSIKGGIIVDDGSGTLEIKKNYMLSPDSLVFSWQQTDGGNPINYYSVGFHRNGFNDKLYYRFLGSDVAAAQDDLNGLVFTSSGIGIGTEQFPPNCRLAVKGKIYATEVNVRNYSNGWPDHVFKSDYQLASLNDVDKFIKTNGHLPGIPNADQIAENGINISDMQSKLLEKVEELTLYMIQLKKENESLKAEIEELKN
jgi:hypothetical protein